jgi:alkaline phosphatase
MKALSMHLNLPNLIVSLFAAPAEWIEIAQKELKRALEVKPITTRPKNVVFFLGDGMGIATLTAGRIYKGQQQQKNGEEGSLAFEKFPHVGLSKVRSRFIQISACPSLFHCAQS